MPARVRFTPRWRTFVLSVVAAIVGFGGVFLGGHLLFGRDSNDQPHFVAGEVGVVDVLAAPRGHTVAVRGFVFIDSTDRVLVCSARHTGAVPTCAGKAIIATGLDENRLDLVTGKAPSGLPIRWSRDAVGLHGTWTGATLTVTDVVR
jgi:hypothetical protein